MTLSEEPAVKRLSWNTLRRAWLRSEEISKKSLMEQETVREVQSKIAENISITPG